MVEEKKLGKLPNYALTVFDLPSKKQKTFHSAMRPGDIPFARHINIFSSMARGTEGFSLLLRSLLPARGGKLATRARDGCETLSRGWAGLIKSIVVPDR
jgi:hypothetical protein